MSGKLFKDFYLELNHSDVLTNCFFNTIAAVCWLKRILFGRLFDACYLLNFGQVPVNFVDLKVQILF